jgi:D-sedoheptulose 7-phosphate isomerase
VGGTIKEVCDHTVIVPGRTTARIQEAHITIGHIWCEMIEEILFKEFII